MDKSNITVAVLTRDNEKTLARTLESVRWAGKLIVIDDESTDESVAIARAFGATVLEKHFDGFAQKRNAALAVTETDWIFYLDADEVVSAALKSEMQKIAQSGDPGTWRVTRDNYFLGTKMYTDVVHRLFHRQVLTEWVGAVHEHPVFTGEVKDLTNHLLHYTHTDITSMLTKTNEWSEIEAQLRIEADHPPMQWWRYITVSLRVWWEQLLKKRVWQYGRAGWFEGYFQMIDKLIVYTKLWERQQHARSRL